MATGDPRLEIGQELQRNYLRADSMIKENARAEVRPAEIGFSMPAEWEKHEVTWLGWPHNPSDWPGKLDTIRWVYGEMVRKIVAGEVVRVLVNTKAAEKLARRYLRSAR